MTKTLEVNKITKQITPYFSHLLFEPLSVSLFHFYILGVSKITKQITPYFSHLLFEPLSVGLFHFYILRPSNSKI